MTNLLKIITLPMSSELGRCSSALEHVTVYLGNGRKHIMSQHFINAIGREWSSEIHLNSTQNSLRVFQGWRTSWKRIFYKTTSEARKKIVPHWNIMHCK